MSDRANDLIIIGRVGDQILWIYAGLSGTTDIVEHDLVDNNYVCNVTLANDNLRLTQGCELWIEEQCSEWYDVYLYELRK